MTKIDPTKIDMVYLWVDGKDPVHRQKRLDLARKLNVKMDNTSDNQENHDARFADHDELKYSLRSLAKYANWINNIYIVTDNQVPQWLNIDHPRIHIVDHKDIMPSDALPCFNSNAIEHCIVNIKELGEYFLYGNDDMFFCNPCYPDDFFVLKTQKAKVYTLKSIVRQKVNDNQLFAVSMYNAYQLLWKKFGKKFDKEMHHNIDPYIKSSMLACKKEFSAEINICVHNHFRALSDVNRTIYTGYAAQNDRALLYYNGRSYGKFPLCIVNFILQRFKKFSKYLECNEIDKFEDCLKRYHSKLICVNASEEDAEDSTQKLQDVFRKWLPDKSEFEI